MVKHMKEKHAEKLKCNICNEELKTEKTLENHYAKKHIVNTIAFLECNSCEYTTMNKYYMTDLEKRQHGNGNTKSFNSFVSSILLFPGVCSAGQPSAGWPKSSPG